MNKVLASVDEAVSVVGDGATVMVGGFGPSGVPEALIGALIDRGVRDLTVISNNAGGEDFGVGLLLKNGQIRKMISTYIGENSLFEAMVLRGEVELELLPQGTFVERIRSAAAGLGGFYTPTGYGTVAAEGKEVRRIGERHYLFEHPLHADFALVKARWGDPLGNLRYYKTARNFNPAMAAAARCTIAEVEQLVPRGELDPDCVHTPGIYVKRLVEVGRYPIKVFQVAG